MSDAGTYAIRKPVGVALLGAALVLVSLNIALTLQNRTLKREVFAPTALTPQVGTRIDRLEGVAPDGSKVEVSFDDASQQTLLFVFSDECRVCDLNWPEWQSVARSVNRERLRLLYANIESTLSPEYTKEYGIDSATVFAELDPRYQLILHLRVTPLTILLSGTGQVTHVWVGLLEGHQLSDLRRIVNLLGSS